MRSGAHTLMLLSDHRNVLILRGLAEGCKRQSELRRATGFPAQTTLRAHLKALEETGTIAKRRRNAFPGTLDYELLKPGTELLFVAAALERWLAAAPEGPLEPGGDRAKTAIRALAEAWSASMLRALAAKPLSLTELDRLIGDLNYPSLERRLGGLRLSGLVEALPGNGRGTPYTVTEWLRQGAAPLAAATRWEHLHLGRRAPALGRTDVEAWFLLALPLLRLPADVNGRCRLTVELRAGSAQRLAGVLVELDRGTLASCNVQLEGSPTAWISGPPGAWLEAVIDADPDRLELGGDCGLARSLLDSLHATLFGGPARKTSAVPNQN